MEGGSIQAGGFLFGNNDFAAAEEARIKRKCAGAKEDKGEGNGGQREGFRGSDAVGRSSGQSGQKGSPQITDRCEGADDGCEHAHEKSNSNDDHERPCDPESGDVAVEDHAGTEEDYVQRNGKPQEDKAEARPSLREGGKEPLQPEPPRGARYAPKTRLAFIAGN